MEGQIPQKKVEKPGPLETMWGWLSPVDFPLLGLKLFAESMVVNMNGNFSNKRAKVMPRTCID